jgi:hypothetical protein
VKFRVRISAYGHRLIDDVFFPLLGTLDPYNDAYVYGKGCIRHYGLPTECVDSIEIRRVEDDGSLVLQTVS